MSGRGRCASWLLKGQRHRELGATLRLNKGTMYFKVKAKGRWEGKQAPLPS